MIKNLLTNWKTTSAGVTMIVTGVVHLAFALKAHALSEADCTSTVLAIAAGVGLLAAGDAGVNLPPPSAPGNNVSNPTTNNQIKI